MSANEHAGVVMLYSKAWHVAMRVLVATFAAMMAIAAVGLGFETVADEQYALLPAVLAGPALSVLAIVPVLKTKRVTGNAAGMTVWGSTGCTEVAWRNVSEPTRPWWAFNPVPPVCQVRLEGMSRTVAFFASERHLTALAQFRRQCTPPSPRRLVGLS